MTEPVIPMSTREWQRFKLGPDPERELRWTMVDLHSTTKAVNRVAESFRVAGAAFEAVGRALVAAFKPVVDEFAKIGIAPR